jgi:Tol biopolymer transport system component
MLTRVLLCAACALLVSATPAHATFPGQNGKIVFTHFDGGNEKKSDIYTVSPNGRNLRNLTPNSPAADDSPSWSADGRRIAFWSTRRGPDNPTGDQEIFVMNANGSGLRQVTKNKVDDGGPAWSPNGDRLVFHRFPGDGSGADLFTVRVNGRGERNLTRSPGIGDLHGVWSPDGREIVFMRDDSGSENDIATIRPDGSNLQALTATDTDEEGPDWSPDGKRIAFHWNAAPHGEDYEVYVMLRDGSSPPTRLTTAEGFTPVWSPDGRKILFSNNPRPRRRGDGPQLFTMRADGSRQKRVRPGFDGHHPDWQPVRKAARAEDDDD